MTFKKGSYVLSLKRFQHVLTKYKSPEKGEVVLFEEPDKSMSFKIVKGLSRSYYIEDDGLSSFYVPEGFLILQNI